MRRYVHRQFIRRTHAAFTLLELMIVLVIVGLLTTVISIKAFPEPVEYLQREAEELTNAVQIAHREGRLRGMSVAFEIDNQGYRFFRLEAKAGLYEWVPLLIPGVVEPHTWQTVPDKVQIERSVANNTGAFRIELGREPLLPHLKILLYVPKAHVTIENISGTLQTDFGRDE